MIIESIKIKNFRTIDSDLTIDMEGALTIVGPNSSGKTNILKSIEMFFTGLENRNQYIHSRDFPEKLDSGQTSLIGTFLLEENDTSSINVYENLNKCLENPKESTDKVNVYLTFTKAGTPSYRLFVGEKHNEDKKKDFTYYERILLENIINAFECHYVPSAKSINNLYKELLLPFIKRSISETLKDKINEIEFALSEISDVMDKQLATVGMGHIKSYFQLPNNSLQDLLSSFEYHLSDPVKTEIERKGMGIQSAAIISSFTWITQEEKKLGKRSVWLVEEPESYVHPELASSCNEMLKSLGESAHLITTTHSLNFVPQDPNKIIGTEVVDGYSKFTEFETYTKATSTIRESLGVKFSDFCNLGLLNIFVEGKTDRELFQWVLSKIKVKATTKHEWTNVRYSEFMDFGGTSALEGFIKATYEYICKERPVVVLLDGDEAGDRTRRNLQGYLGKKDISFLSNKQFVMLPKGFTLEGLFLESWIIEANELHPNWFKDFSIDMNGKLLPFSSKSETTKGQLREFLKRKVEEQDNEDWAVNFCNLFDVLDDALESQKVLN